MLWVDWIILGIIALSTLLSLFRGLVREVLALAGWVVAILLASQLSSQVAALLPVTFSPNLPAVRWWSAFSIIVVLVLLVFGVINFIVGKIISATGLTATDRMLGIIFGAARGVLICTILMTLFVGLFPNLKNEWWPQSVFLPQLQNVALMVRQLLPEEYQGYINFPS